MQEIIQKLVEIFVGPRPAYAKVPVRYNKFK